ncbi:hypothetical protein QEH56_16105 [Pelagicoccus enzymogenes]|uniref:hypothetical protein n=1 Tax=Pelagicoccus enzymogenes TaxID=2773457 RepID=UPI00280D982F|nr:hypothetical protein [Pelagicoccus enzymogenes]MDQ8199686.1 hypothetical protein [Pelagicoccus enzymogenes]
MPYIYNFEKNRIEAERILEGLNLEKVLRRHFSDYVDHLKATKKQDKAGTDYLVRRGRATHRVDFKLIRKKTPRIGSRRDCLPVEYYSVKERGIRGYEGDADYIIWVYADTLRSVCVERKALREYIDGHHLEWTYFLEERETKTRMRSGYVYTSTFFKVPTWVVEGVGRNDLGIAA